MLQVNYKTFCRRTSVSYLWLTLWYNSQKRYLMLNKSPMFYAGLYLILIPVFAFLYFYAPFIILDLQGHTDNLVTSFYFSIVTITTLGYGDIKPIGEISKIVTASQSLFGILFIGLFLNALSHNQAAAIESRERKSVLKKVRYKDAQSFLTHDKLIGSYTSQLFEYMIPITTSMQERDYFNFNDKFEFKDMHCLYKPTLKYKDSINTPAVELYFKKQESLVSALKMTLSSGALSPYPDIEDIFVKYISATNTLDSKDAILANGEKYQIGDKAIGEYISEFNGPIEYMYSHPINTYLNLYQQLKVNIQFYQDYKNHRRKVWYIFQINS